MDTEKMLSNGWMRVRDAGEAAMNYPLVRQFPKVKEWAATGAGLAVAKRGTKVAVRAVRKHPVMAVAGVVALAGLGLVAMAARKRKAAQASDGSHKPRTVKAKNMRGKTRSTRSRSSGTASE